MLDIVSADAGEIRKVPRTGNGDEANFLSGIVTRDNVTIAHVEAHVAAVQRGPPPSSFAFNRRR